MSRGRFEQKKKKSKAGKTILIVLAVILGLILAAVIAGVIYYNSILDKMQHVEVPKIEYTVAATEAPTEATEVTEEPTEAPTETVHIPSSEDYVNILLVGQASRWGEEERFADTMILVTLNKYEKTLKLTSFLRDSLVKPPDFRNKRFGNIKLTTVYHLGSYYDKGNIAGSMELMNMTLFNNFGVEVDHNFEVDFDAFIKIIDLLGGVEIELTEAEADYLNKQDAWVKKDVSPGKQKLYGSAALCYARMRKAEGDGDSDITRTNRQRKLIGILLEKLKTRNLTQLQELANEVLPYVTTSMTKTEITDMLLMVLPMITDLKIEMSGTCPVEGTYGGKLMDIYKDGMMHSVLTFNVQEQTRLMRALTEGESAE